MIEVEVTGEMLVRARDKAAAMGRLRQSITRGQGNLAGFVGEEIALAVLGGTITNDKTTWNIDYDLVLPNGLTVDVKTKRTSVKPLPHYECSISSYYEQKCDLYAFVRVHNDMHIGWFLGVYDRVAYYKDCTHFRKGDIDKSNGFKFKADCFNIAINQLKDVSYATAA